MITLLFARSIKELIKSPCKLLSKIVRRGLEHSRFFYNLSGWNSIGIRTLIVLIGMSGYKVLDCIQAFNIIGPLFGPYTKRNVAQP